ncbi:MAG: hypothetical protein HYS22_05060 [Deltaproteobacteria bacterium]|nr:hypothetical protein [Deltaproteobacteria bacterium]
MRREPKAEIIPARGNLIPVGPDQKTYDQFLSGRFNVVFVPTNFDVSTHWFTRERAVAIAQSIIADPREEARGILETAPFDSPENRARLQFWLWWPRRGEPLTRGASEMCSAAEGGSPKGDSPNGIDTADARIEAALQTYEGVTAPAMDHLIFVNLLNTECRPQGTWFDISSVEQLQAVFPAQLYASLDARGVRDAVLSNPENLFSDPERLKAIVLGAVNFRQLAEDLFHRFRSARIYLPIPPAVAAGQRDLTPHEVQTYAGHEFPHAAGHLVDLYQEDLHKRGKYLPAMGSILALLDRDYDLLELLDLQEPLEEIAQQSGFSGPIPTVRVNLLTELLRRPEVEQALGSPLGWPHCATSPEEGRAWAMKLGVNNPEDYFQDAGCLYFGSDPNRGPLFYRSSDSAMYDPNKPLDPLETAAIRYRFDCELPEEPPASCIPPPWR